MANNHTLTLHLKFRVPCQGHCQQSKKQTGRRILQAPPPFKQAWLYFEKWAMVSVAYGQAVP